jgi:hypothetical protein
MSANDDFAGPSQTVIKLAGKESTLTLQDAQTMKAALLQHLATSTVADRDDLIQMIQEVPGWIDEDGFLRIGPWLLQAGPSALILTNRLPHGPTAGGAYAAYLEKSPDGWRVTKLEFERIKYRQ